MAVTGTELSVRGDRALDVAGVPEHDRQVEQRDRTPRPHRRVIILPEPLNGLGERRDGVGGPTLVPTGDRCVVQGLGDDESERRVIGAVEPGDDGLGDADRCLELAQLAEACALQNRLVALDDFDGHELVGTGMQRFIQRCGLLIHGLGLWVVGTSAGEQPLQMLQCFVDLAASREDDCCVVHRQVDEAAHVRPCIVREPRNQSAVADERLASFPRTLGSVRALREPSRQSRRVRVAHLADDTPRLPAARG